MTAIDDSTEVRRLIRHGWEEVAAEYAQDRVGIFGQSAKRLLERLHPSPGSRLLDVGAGTGAVALQAAGYVGPTGQVIGTDIATAMVSCANQAAAEQELTSVTFHQMDAEQLDFPDAAFDAVTCAFSLFQFPDMSQALSEMWRVLKIGGKLGLSNWAPGYFSPIASLQRDLFRRFRLKALLPNPIVFKPATLQAQLHEVGFTLAEMFEEVVDVWFKSPEEVWAFNLDMGPFPVMLRQQLSNAQQEELEQQFLAMLEDLRTEQGIGCRFHLLYTLAGKGGAEHT